MVKISLQQLVISWGAFIQTSGIRKWVNATRMLMFCIYCSVVKKSTSTVIFGIFLRRDWNQKRVNVHAVVKPCCHFCLWFWTVLKMFSCFYALLQIAKVIKKERYMFMYRFIPLNLLQKHVSQQYEKLLADYQNTIDEVRKEQFQATTKSVGYCWNEMYKAGGMN